MVYTDNQVLIPLDGSVKVGYTRGGSVVADGVVFIGRYSYEAGHPKCNPDGLCVAVRLS